LKGRRRWNHDQGESLHGIRRHLPPSRTSMASTQRAGSSQALTISVPTRYLPSITNKTSRHSSSSFAIISPFFINLISRPCIISVMKFEYFSS
jgi:hypothetical protein